MSPPDPLERLRDLDRFSREFSDQLADVLLMEDCMTRAQTLPDNELTKFVEDLDYGLDIFDSTGINFCRCLFELQRVCGTRKVLPASHLLTETLLDVNNHVIASGVIADIHEGLLEDLRVRVKKVRVYSVDDPDKVELFQLFYREAVVWKRVRHRNIVPFHGATFYPRQLVLDWMEDGNLREFLEEYPKANRLGLLNDVAEGLNYLHSCNIIHGGISGNDILVDRFSRARVGDFTFATIDPSQGTLEGTHYGATVLSNLPARWTAPEVLKEKGPPSAKSDVFSFAMVMYEVFAGEVPFESIPPYTTVIKITNGDRPQRPTSPHLTKDVWELMQRCWKQKARLRPAMSTVLQDLAPCLFRTLHQFIEFLPEFQVSLNQFYDSTERKAYVDTLSDGQLKKFIDLLDDVLRIDGLDERLKQQTLHILREVCGQKAVVPDSCLFPCKVSKLATEPYSVTEYAEVWNSRIDRAEGGDHTVDLCIKVIRPKARKVFHWEVALWVKLDHPNIVKCYGITSSPLQVVTEWMPNGHTMKYAQNHKPPDRVSLLIDIARGLDYLHSCGVVHGNLKQGNILLDSGNNARLSDIGFADPIPTTKFDLAQTGAEGCRWAAPEVFQKGEFTRQSDVFSYGFLAAEIFLGKYLWEESGTLEVRSRILERERPSRPLDRERHAYAVELWRMFSLCWGDDLASRSSISAVLQVLEHLPLDASYVLKKASDQENGKALIDRLDKILDAGMVFPKERPVILNRLCKNCDIERSLPKSMIITNASLQYKSKIPETGGGFGDVYRGEFGGRPVAIKVMRLWVSSDLNNFLSRFCREAVSWRHLRHPNILPLFGAIFDLQSPKFALVSKWMDKGDINAFIRKHQEANRVQLLVDVALGLQYLHGFRFVHGDLKGANILINDDNRACLADFGLSTNTYARPRLPDSATAEVSRVSANPETTLMGYSSGGTDRWTSPELLLPEHFGFSDTRPTTQSDCYALGMVIYEVMCGKMPYWQLKTNIVQAVLEGRKPSKPAEAAELGFTDSLWWIVDCCWLQDRDMRPDVTTVLSRLTDAAWAWDMRPHVGVQIKQVPISCTD